MSSVGQEVEPSRSSPPVPDDEPRGAVAVHYASLAVAFVLLLTLAITRELWFFFEEWYAVTDWFLPTGPRYSYFLPFNNQLNVAALVLLRGLFSIFGLRTYAPYEILALVFHLGVAHLLWRVCRSAGVSTWIATGLVAAFLINGGGAQNLFFPFMIIFLGALVFGLATVLLLNRDHADRRLDVLAVVTALVSLAFSPVGVALVAVAAVVVLLRRGLRPAAAFVAVPAAAYVLWFLVYGSGEGGGPSADQPPYRPQDLTKMPALVWRGLVVAVETSTIFVGAGAVLIIALGLWLYSRREIARTAAAPVFAMCIGAVVFYMTVSLARVDRAGAEQASKSRYVYVGWCLLLPAVALAIDYFVRSPRARMVVALTLAAVLSLNGLEGALSILNEQSKRDVALKKVVLESASIVSTEPFLPGVVVRRAPGNDEAGSLTAEKLAELVRGGYLPSLPRLSGKERLDAALPLQVTLASSPTFEPDPAGAPVVGTVSGATTGTDADGCLVVTPTSLAAPSVELQPRRAASVRVDSSEGGRLGVALQSADSDEVSSELEERIVPGTSVYVDLAGTTNVPILTLPRFGTSTLCGVRAPGL